MLCFFTCACVPARGERRESPPAPRRASARIMNIGRSCGARLGSGDGRRGSGRGSVRASNRLRSLRNGLTERSLRRPCRSVSVPFAREKPSSPFPSGPDESRWRRCTSSHRTGSGRRRSRSEPRVRSVRPRRANRRPTGARVIGRRKAAERRTRSSAAHRVRREPGTAWCSRSNPAGRTAGPASIRATGPIGSDLRTHVNAPFCTPLPHAASPSHRLPKSAIDRNPHPPGLCARHRNPRSWCVFIILSKRGRSVGSTRRTATSDREKSGGAA